MGPYLPASGKNEIQCPYTISEIGVSHKIPAFSLHENLSCLRMFLDYNKLGR